MSNKRKRGAQFGKRGSNDGSELHVWGGIVSARVADLADALDATPEELLEALEESGVEPLTDTAKQKRQERDRPTDPALRSIALTTEALETLRDTLRNEAGAPQETIG
jgi:hypothetical protein